LALSPTKAAAIALQMSTSKPAYRPSGLKKLKPGIFPLTPHNNSPLDCTKSNLELVPSLRVAHPLIKPTKPPTAPIRRLEMGRDIVDGTDRIGLSQIFKQQPKTPVPSGG
jgi:hypothetical protein